MENTKKLSKALIISASIIGGSILGTGILGFLNCRFNKPNHPPVNNVCHERKLFKNSENHKHKNTMMQSPKGEHKENHEHNKENEKSPVPTK